MKLTLYQIDTFTDKLFCGNPAAVIPLEKWIDDELMQKIALENNLIETVFFVPISSFGGVRGMLITKFVGLRRNWRLIFAAMPH